MNTNSKEYKETGCIVYTLEKEQKAKNGYGISIKVEMASCMELKVSRFQILKEVVKNFLSFLKNLKL